MRSSHCCFRFGCSKQLSIRIIFIDLLDLVRMVSIIILRLDHTFVFMLKYHWNSRIALLRFDVELATLEELGLIDFLLL